MHYCVVKCEDGSNAIVSMVTIKKEVMENEGDSIPGPSQAGPSVVTFVDNNSTNMIKIKDEPVDTDQPSTSGTQQTVKKTLPTFTRILLNPDGSIKNTIESYNKEMEKTIKQEPLLKHSLDPSTFIVNKKIKPIIKLEEVKLTWEQMTLNEYDNCKTLESRESFRENTIEQMEKLNKYIPHLKLPGKFFIKYEQASPYHVFLSTIESVQATWNQQHSITFPEILDKSIGVIEKTLIINDQVDFTWLRFQYLFSCQKTDSLIIYGQRMDTGPLPDNIETHQYQQHSKIMVIKYENGARIVISTANLFSNDWNIRTQGVWISPHLPYLEKTSKRTQGESPTNFKQDFINYMKKYSIDKLHEWIEIIWRLDFSSVKVFFVGSAPGNYSYDSNEISKWGIKKLGNVLSNNTNVLPDDENWPVVIQCTSIGGLGTQTSGWLKNEILPVLMTNTNRKYSSPCNFKIIYPTTTQYANSFDKNIRSLCLHYYANLHAKQKWVVKHLHQWKSSTKSRDVTLPHTKFYTRISLDYKKVPWVLLTSANLSKSAWGSHNNNSSWNNRWSNKWKSYSDSEEEEEDTWEIKAFEAGVAFFPKQLTGGQTFPIQSPDPDGTPPFPLPFDVPLTPYQKEDQPFLI
ncbi:hypothetical protein HCN44_001615 [Aphidius gifuensis]|uniref:Tyrosyl-DNA phosphodiesterase n=1 Tax=Aphidius gifuensis TaxID=684658 RepID=A0A834XUH0_APHGI|nr:probable tyrosyl-DNA phosphodiesterase [Aphidius gifuensis]KAF7992290.1 hypothetical protein HCN44_001615 [Aphidius gifuensis]